MKACAIARREHLLVAALLEHFGRRGFQAIYLGKPMHLVEFSYGNSTDIHRCEHTESLFPLTARKVWALGEFLRGIRIP